MVRYSYEGSLKNINENKGFNCLQSLAISENNSNIQCIDSKSILKNNFIQIFCPICQNVLTLGNYQIYCNTLGCIDLNCDFQYLIYPILNFIKECDEEHKYIVTLGKYIIIPKHYMNFLKM